MKLRTGEVIDIRIVGAEVGFAHPTDGHTLVRIGERGDEAPGEDRRDIVSLDLDHPAIEVRRVRPDAGEPAVGEVWRDARGELYYAAWRTGEVVLIEAANRTGYLVRRWQDVHQGPRGPITLEWRGSRTEAPPEVEPPSPSDAAFVAVRAAIKRADE